MKEDKQFTQMLQEQQIVIYKICRMYAHDEHEVKDLYQEVAFQLWRAFPSFEGRSKTKTWVYRIALNTILARFRRRQPKLLYSEKLPESIAAVNDSPSARGEQLMRAIKQLPETERAFIALYLEDYDHQEIGEILGISSNNVSVKLHRITNKLKHLLKQQ